MTKNDVRLQTGEGSHTEENLRVFLCYSSDDKLSVRDIYYWLRTEGVKPWFDDEDLLPGQEWRDEISRVVRDVDVVLVCLSQSSLDKSGFVQKELKQALDIADEQPAGSIFVIPVRLEECNIPDRLKSRHWVNLFEESGYKRLMQSLRHQAKRLGRVITPAPSKDYKNETTVLPSHTTNLEQTDLRLNSPDASLAFDNDQSDYALIRRFAAIRSAVDLDFGTIDPDEQGCTRSFHIDSLLDATGHINYAAPWFLCTPDTFGSGLTLCNVVLNMYVLQPGETYASEIILTLQDERIVIPVRVKVRPFSDTGVKQILTDAETYRSTIQKVQEELKQVRLAYDEMKKQLHEQEQSYKTQLKALSQQRDAVASDYDRLSAEKDELQKQYTSLQDEVQRLRQLQEEVRQIQLAYTATKKQLDEQEQLHQRQLDDFKQQIIDIGQARIKEITNLMQQHEAILNDLSRIREEKDELQKQYNLLRDAVQRLRQALDHEERQIESFKDAFACLNEAVRDLYGTWVKYIPETHSLNTPYQHLIDIWSQTVAAYHQSDEAEVIVQIYRLGKAFDDMISEWKSFWYSTETFVVLKLFNAAHDAWKKAYANLPYKQMGRTATESDKVKLTSEVSEFQANNEQLSGELATARASNSKVERQIQELHNQVKQQERWQQANRRKLEQFDWLEQQAQRAAALEAELHAAQHRIRQLEADRRQLLGELGQKGTDFDNTSVSGSRPQHEELVRQFRQLRDDGIEPAVRAIFNYMSRQDPSLKSAGQRREKLAFIKASISTRILVEVEVGESSDVQTSSDRVVVEQILHRLELPAQAQELDEIRGLLVPLVAEGLQLAQQVEAAHPRGILWIEKVGEPFDSQRHETVAGSSESGPVSFTIFPGYDVGNRILVPAVVWTSKIRN